jgi:hypothetical protein
MKQVGTLKKIYGKVFSFLGEIDGRVVCAYSENMKGQEQLRIMELEDRDLGNIADQLSREEKSRQLTLERKLKSIEPNPNQINLL